MISNIVLMPRIGPKPLVGLGMLIAAAGMVWLTRIGVHSGYPDTLLGPLMVVGAGIGMSLPPAMNAGTFGVAPTDADVCLRACAECVDEVVHEVSQRSLLRLPVLAELLAHAGAELQLLPELDQPDVHLDARRRLLQLQAHRLDRQQQVNGS